MSIKDKIMNLITKHPRLLTFGIGLAITFAIGTVIGMMDNHSFVFARVQDQNTLVIPTLR